MSDIWEKAISIFAGYLNSGLSYLITTIPIQNRVDICILKSQTMFFLKKCQKCKCNEENNFF